MLGLTLLLIIFKVLQYLESALNDTLDGSILVDLLGQVLIINVLYPSLLDLFLRSMHPLLIGLRDLLVVFGRDDDFVLVEGLLTV